MLAMCRQFGHYALVPGGGLMRLFQRRDPRFPRRGLELILYNNWSLLAVFITISFLAAPLWWTATIAAAAILLAFALLFASLQIDDEYVRSRRLTTFLPLLIPRSTIISVELDEKFLDVTRICRYGLWLVLSDGRRVALPETGCRNRKRAEAWLRAIRSALDDQED